MATEPLPLPPFSLREITKLCLMWFLNWDVSGGDNVFTSKPMPSRVWTDVNILWNVPKEDMAECWCSKHHVLLLQYTRYICKYSTLYVALSKLTNVSASCGVVLQIPWRLTCRKVAFFTASPIIIKYSYFDYQCVWSPFWPFKRHLGSNYFTSHPNISLCFYWPPIRWSTYHLKQEYE